MNNNCGLRLMGMIHTVFSEKGLNRDLNPDLCNAGAVLCQY